MYEKRLNEIAARKLEIRAMLEGGENVDMTKINEELQALEAEGNQLEARKVTIERLKSGAQPDGMRKLETSGQDPEAKTAQAADAEKRGRDLKEYRSVTVASSGIVLPAHKATDIKPTFNEVSSLLDRVNVLPLKGGESFTQPYLKGNTAGDYKTEGSDYATAEPSFDYATMGKAKITAYAEDTEEVLKLPAAAYDSMVMQGITTSLRRKVTGEILVGDGATNHLMGIFDDGATAIDAATDIPLTTIDEESLDEILYGFGGDENVEDVAVLILNKLDLKAFATLRDANGRKIHTVVNRGNAGTIDGVPFIINSACKAIVDPATTTGQYCLAYGPLSNYTLAIFSDIDVQRSTDFKFKSGHIAHRGSIFCGGNVTAYNGFLRVKKG